MVSPLVKPEEISQWLDIPTLNMHYKHDWNKPETELNHIQALQEYFIYNDLSISYNVLFAEARFLARIFPKFHASHIINLLREVGNEPNRIRMVAKKLCFLKVKNKPIHGSGISISNALNNKRALEQRGWLENDGYVKKSKSDCNENIKSNNVTVNNFELKKAIENAVSKIDQKPAIYFPEIVKSISEIQLPERTLAATNITDTKWKQKDPLPQQHCSLVSIKNKIEENGELSCNTAQGIYNSLTDCSNIPSESNNTNLNQRPQYFRHAYSEQIETITSTTMFNKQKVQTTPIGVNLSIEPSKSTQHSLFSESCQVPFDIFSEEPNQNCSLIMNNYTQHTISFDSKPLDMPTLEIDASSTTQTENKNIPFVIVPSTSKDNFVPSFNRMSDKNINNSISTLSSSQGLLDNIINKAYDNFPVSTTPINMEWLSEINSSVPKIEKKINTTHITLTEHSENNADTSKRLQVSPSQTVNIPTIMNTEKLNINVSNENVPIDLTVDIEEEDVQIQPATTEETETNPLVYQLMEIFPQACPDYLRRICKNRSIRSNEIDNLISEILSSDYPRRKNIEEEPKEMDVNELFEHLKELLPNADPTYLEMKAEQLANKPNELKVFISNAFERHDYPTMKEYLRRVKLSSQQKQYTTDFTVENFLEVISDPFTYFRDPTRKSNVKDHNQDVRYVLAFLKNKYPQVPVKIISSIDICKFNLIKVCQLLDKAMPMKSKRKQIPLPKLLENIPLLQEIAFIHHEEEIRSFIKVLKAKEEQEREITKQNGLFQTCQCCFDDEVMPKDIAHCNEGCIFCKSCVSKSIEVAFGNGKLQFPCLSTCTSEFSLQTLQNVLNPKIFSKIALKKQVEEVKAAGIEDIESCPFCDFVSIPAKDDKLFRCHNPSCMKESCRQCKEPSHVPLRCDEVEKDEDVKARIYIENKMTEALIRKCYKCELKFVKSDGCNKMTCSCGATMCYICNKPVIDYKHFNGQGGTNFELCPLYSDTDKLHVENVLKSANEAKAELGKENLKIDPTADLQKHYKKRRKSNILQPPMDPFVVMNAAERILQEEALNFFLRNENIERLDGELNRIELHRQQHQPHHRRHNVHNRRSH